MEALADSAPVFAAPSKVRIIIDDVRRGLARLDPESVQTVVCSPPYWSLRSYKTEPQVWGGDLEHEHEWGAPGTRTYGNLNEGFNHRWNPAWAVGGKQDQARPRTVQTGSSCPCGSWLGELGSEPTPELYVKHIVEVFRHVWRVLRRDGVAFINIGDSYSGSGKGPTTGRSSLNGGRGVGSTENNLLRGAELRQGFVNQRTQSAGLKPKDRCGIPWRVALALQAAGWYWRDTICWAKTSCMPESVEDRFTNAWEPILFMTKSRRYFFDAEAVREKTELHPGNAGTFARINSKRGIAVQPGQAYGTHRATREDRVPAGSNMRNVWLLGPSPYPGAHFATFVPEVPRRCIAAGTSEKGACPECGAPWRRVTDARPTGAVHKMPDYWDTGPGAHGAFHRNGREKGQPGIAVTQNVTTGWEPSCKHSGLQPRSCLVLDPFAGAGTTLMVAARMGRESIGIELNAKYAEMAAYRIRDDGGFTVDVQVEATHAAD